MWLLTPQKKNRKETQKGMHMHICVCVHVGMYMCMCVYIYMWNILELFVIYCWLTYCLLTFKIISVILLGCYPSGSKNEPIQFTKIIAIYPAYQKKALWISSLSVKTASQVKWRVILVNSVGWMSDTSYFSNPYTFLIIQPWTFFKEVLDK